MPSMENPMDSLSPVSLVLAGILGMALVGLSWRVLITGRSGGEGEGLHRDLDRLLSEITRGLRVLASPGRAGGLFYREKQEEVGRLLSELQGRLRLLEDSLRQPYEAKASQVLADAARAGITLPPLETPLISGIHTRA
jgi:hypothetical protein